MPPKGKKFYAVRKGLQPGIYLTWADCEKQVKGFSGAEFKSFSSREEAEEFTGNVAASTPGPALSPIAFAHSPVPVKRSRSPGLGHPSNRAEDDVYQIEFDGAAKGNPGWAGAGAVVRNPDGSVVCELREGLGSASNNVAEYRAFILGLKGALDRGIYRVRAQGDSKLIVEQILGRYKVRKFDLIPLCEEALRLIQNFAEFSIRHVDREFNSAADKLANEAVFLPETKFVSSFP